MHVYQRCSWRILVFFFFCVIVPPRLAFASVYVSSENIQIEYMLEVQNYEDGLECGIITITITNLTKKTLSPFSLSQCRLRGLQDHPEARKIELKPDESKTVKTYYEVINDERKSLYLNNMVFTISYYTVDSVKTSFTVSADHTSSWSMK